jgi:Pumilio-family RNA binding repeat
MSRPTSLQSSYSTNDLPTVKTSNLLTSNVTPPKTHAEQHLHNHNASMGRIPLGAVNNRQSRDLGARLSLTEPKAEESSQSALSNQSALQASAAPFGPQVSSATQPSSLVNAASPGSVAFNNGSQMYAYGMHSYNVNQMSAQMALNSQLQAYQNQSQGNFGQYGAYGQYGKDNLQRGPGRRLHNGDEARFNNIPLENYQGKLYELCKDQHGCRYLQRKLEDGNAEQTQAIFMETRPHIVELMTGTFCSTHLIVVHLLTNIRSLWKLSLPEAVRALY